MFESGSDKGIMQEVYQWITSLPGIAEKVAKGANPPLSEDLLVLILGLYLRKKESKVFAKIFHGNKKVEKKGGILGFHRRLTYWKYEKIKQL